MVVGQKDLEGTAVVILEPHLLARQMGTVKPGPAEGRGPSQSQDRTRAPPLACGLVQSQSLGRKPFEA